MRDVFAATIFIFFALASAHAQGNSFTLRKTCAQDICVEMSYLGDSVELYPISSSTDTYAWIPKDRRGVSLKVANKSSGPGYACLAARDETGNLVSIPGRLPVAEKLETYHGPQKVELRDWLTKACIWVEQRKYVSIPAHDDGAEISVLGQAGRPSLSLIAAFFPVTDFLRLLVPGEEPDPKNLVIQSESSSNIRVLSGGEVLPITLQPRRRRN